MSNVPKSSRNRAHTTDIDLAKMISNLERAIGNQANPSFLTTFRWQGKKVEKQIDTFEDVYVRRRMFSVHSRTLYETFTGVSFSVLKPSATQRTNQRDRTGGNEAHLRAQMKKYFLKTAEEAPLDACQICFESASHGLKEASFRLVESMLMNIALKKGLDSILERNIEKWAQSSFFMNEFACRALASTTFVRPVVNFICNKGEEQFGKVEGVRKIAEDLFFLPSCTPSYSEASADVEKRRHGKKNQDIKVEEESSKTQNRYEALKAFIFIGKLLQETITFLSFIRQWIIPLLSESGKNHKGKVVEPELPVYKLWRWTMLQH